MSTKPVLTPARDVQVALVTPRSTFRQDGGVPEKTMTARRIADDYVHRIASLDPMTSTRLGLFPGDHRQSDLSPDGFDALAEGCRRALAALNAAPAGEGPVELACDRLLRERLAAELALHAAGDHYRQLRNVNSAVHRVRRIFALMPTDTEDDWAAAPQCAGSAGRLPPDPHRGHQTRPAVRAAPGGR
ncbi:DUF885 family protein [Streptomyces griseocarneus]|uniref:DUF885 family protein n=2 Tax=Streptomyces TaxID=1883 RepID=A0ABX7RPM1_9ACTN|nr:DUF885 family protein [Streptomyces griseocarneus]QSY49319.1 DUF885 family protein [Streptomyces griseocarneus]